MAYCSSAGDSIHDNIKVVYAYTICLQIIVFGTKKESAKLKSGEDNKSKRAIRNAAYNLMWTEGYEGASYTAIAQRSGFGRPLVQKHFPKKEQLVCDLTEDLLTNCIRLLAERKLIRESESAAANALRVGQLFYSALLQSEASLKLARYALGQQSVFIVISNIQTRYAYELGLSRDREQLRISVVLANGSVNQFVLDRIAHGESLDADHLSLLYVAGLLVINNDEKPSQALGDLKSKLLNRAVVDEIVIEVLDAVLGVREEADSQQAGRSADGFPHGTIFERHRLQGRP